LCGVAIFRNWGIGDSSISQSVSIYSQFLEANNNKRKMSAFVNHYVVLGVSPSASAAEIANAWGDVYRSYTSGSLDANKALWIEASFKVLSNPTERALFDCQLRRHKEEQELRALREEYQLLSDKKRLLEQWEQDRRRKSEQNSLDAELRRQEAINESLRRSLEGFHLGSPKVKQPLSSCVCRFCGKETSRPQSLRQHLAAMSTDMHCVERKILYLLQASHNLSEPDYELLDGICDKLAKASDAKIRQLEAKVPTLIAFQVRFADQISMAK
jgi:curved DNA-binding protein CbpA